jgi:hypothetical protein
MLLHDIADQAKVTTQQEGSYPENGVTLQCEATCGTNS